MDFRAHELDAKRLFIKVSEEKGFNLTWVTQFDGYAIFLTRVLFRKTECRLNFTIRQAAPYRVAIKILSYDEKLEEHQLEAFQEALKEVASRIKKLE